MREPSVPAMLSPARGKDNPLTRSKVGLVGMAVLGLLALMCLAWLPYSLGTSDPLADSPAQRLNDQFLVGHHMPPAWAGRSDDDRARFEQVLAERRERVESADGRREARLESLREQAALHPERSAAIGAQMASLRRGPDPERPWYWYWWGADSLGRDFFTRCLAGGGISIGIGLAAACISVCIGTLWGAVAASVGGRVDALMMRIVDVLYGLPYVLLVVLLSVAGDAMVDRVVSNAGARDAWVLQQATELMSGDRAAAREMLEQGSEALAGLREQAIEKFPPRELSDGQRRFIEIGVMLVAIGGVSWLTMARVIRGQVLSLRSQPFMEAARALGVPFHRQFVRHLLPNLVGPITVYATLTVPQAILQESFLSFLGIGVKAPLPSWGNLAAQGLVELSPVTNRWWLMVFPCALLGTTLLALNFVGEGLREAFDPRRARK